jgi:hypothetical protein
MRIDATTSTAQKIEISDLSADLQHLADVIGLELVRKLIIEFGGTGNALYFPDALSYDKAVFRMIEDEYAGVDIRDISIRTGISHRKLKAIVNKHRKEYS